MPLYRFHFVDRSQKIQKGVIFGLSASDAKEKAFDQGIAVVRIEPLNTTRSAYQLNRKTLLSFFTQLSQLLTSHLPLYEALQIVSEHFKKTKAYPTLLAITEMVRSGSKLSEALSHFTSSIHPELLAMIEAGEASGSVHLSVHEVQKLLEWQSKNRQKLSQAIAYPLFLLAFSFLILLTLLLFVIPSMEEVLSLQKGQGISYLLFSLSHFIREHGVALLLGFSLLLGSIVIYSRYHKLSLYPFMERIPFLQKALYSFSFLRFTKLLHDLLKQKILLPQALPIASQTIPSKRLKEKLLLCCKDISEGVPFSTALEKENIPSKPLIDMVEIGERGARLETSVYAAYQYYEQQTQKILTKIQTYAQPILLLFIGLVVGGVMLAILLPLSDMSGLNI